MSDIISRPSTPLTIQEKYQPNERQELVQHGYFSPRSIPHKTRNLFSLYNTGENARNFLNRTAQHLTTSPEIPYKSPSNSP